MELSLTTIPPSAFSPNDFVSTVIRSVRKSVKKQLETHLHLQISEHSKRGTINEKISQKINIILCYIIVLVW